MMDAKVKKTRYAKPHQLKATNYDGNFQEQEYLPKKLSGTKLYDPGDNQADQKLRERLKALWKEKYRY